MKKGKVAVIILFTASLTSACAGGYAGQGYTPVIDVYGSGKDPAYYPQDLAECQALSNQRNQIADTAKGAGVGAGVGAAGGALAGAIDGGNALSVAGWGALGGLLVGGAHSAYESNQNRQNVVMSCMSSRGWVVTGR